MRRVCPKRGSGLRAVSVVMLVTGVVTGVLLGRVGVVRSEVAVAACDQNVAQINGAIERWYLSKGCWPLEDLTDIAQDPSYFPDGIPTCPVTGEVYTMDSEVHRVVYHGHRGCRTPR